MRVQATPDLDFLHTLSVLYVEDDAEAREALSHFLRRRFARVDVAENGSEGLQRFTSGRQDVVITDVKMPEMDGLEMASAIKSMAAETPVIVVTAYNETDYFLRAIEIGVDRFVMKPVNTDELLESIYKGTLTHFQRLQLEKAHQENLETLQQIIGALSRAIEQRDPYTDGHQKRVSQLSVAIAEEMKLPPAQVTAIRLGALIHDVGKIAVPLELLTMPRRFNSMEFGLVKMHPGAGAEILRDIAFPWPIQQMVLQHHERLDGSGYPKGLAGSQICLEAKIIMVADVVEAMASHRPYRPALGLDAAIAEIKTKQNLLYDTNVVASCLRVMERGEVIL